MEFTENIKEALTSIKNNLLRSLLTLLIIAVGITCLVGILTAIDAILFSMSDNFNRMGANTFRIRPADETIKTTKDGKKQVESPAITFDQAVEFKDKFRYSGAHVSIETRCESGATIKWGEEKTNPNVNVFGIDENYFTTSSLELEMGRNFSINENNKVILGADIVKKLFDDKPEKALGKSISVNSDRYEVIGVLKKKGSGSGGGGDRVVYIPLLPAKFRYGFADKNYSVSIAMSNATMVDAAINKATGIMRNIRKLSALDQNDFEIRKSDSILQKLKEMTSTLRLSTVIIAMLTLLGASIGLMNIMLVSVTERTKEIGVRKALGATSNNILIQFLTEAIVICLLGGVVGIVLGIGMGYGITLIIKGRFFIPWAWITLGIIVCIVVGIVSGLYPALKAAKLDPIEALRYE
ncbi:MAG: ABC transporter permease [Saprospiraceae bacterium]|nr:ABC transporter permease [Saprospiraceae bacterium]MBK7220156.1 ABC transporter permease [Saprospiraceae bacterium]MBK7787354.1 ABC transporter permease [Saprospiraceae bacterium]MBK8109832.1 ABC transporter permease [Saprospiraceae bacterium]MBK8849344.1 ABC transporter permease [Saprospiraceae bacterium]